MYFFCSLEQLEFKTTVFNFIHVIDKGLNIKR
jgi:hypothetical protein